MSAQTVRGLWLECRDALRAAQIENALPELDWLWQAVFGLDRHLMDAAMPVEQQKARQLLALVRRRCSREPLQYLLGSWPFMDFTLAVAPGVLIPRADTECVARQAITLGRRIFSAAGAEKLTALDLCAGTGALALALAKHLQRPVTAVELSDEAFPLLQQNIQTVTRQFGCPTVQPVKADIFTFQNALPPASVGLIVSNPPYLTGSEMSSLQPEVRFEPAMALYGGQDGLDFYRHIAAAYRPALAEGGALVLEIGAQQAKAVQQLLRQNGWRQITLLQDEQGRDRCVSAFR